MKRPPKSGSLFLQTTALPVPEQPANILECSIPILDEFDDIDEWLASYGTDIKCLITHAMHGAPKDLLARLPNLQLITNFGAGINLIDIAYTKQRGIMVAASGDALTGDVADLSIWLILSLLRGNAGADQFIRNGCWVTKAYPLGKSLAKQKLGIVGFGRIGQAVAQRAEVFNMQIAYHSRAPVARSKHQYMEKAETLAHWADILIVMLPGGAETHHFVNQSLLDALGPHGFLVNVSRGSVVDEYALINTLNDGRLRGAALDVFNNEPDINAELFATSNLLLSPHIGSATSDARQAMLHQVVGNLRAFIDGGLISGLVST